MSGARRVLLAAIPAVAISPVLSACGGPDWQQQVEGWHYTEPIPDLALVDQDGRDFRLSRYDGQHLLVGFVFTRCPVEDACPLTMQRLRSTVSAWERAGEPGELSVLALTLDPDWDTPARLKAFGIAHGADLDRWTLATGPRGLMTDGLPSMFGVLALPDRHTILDHSVKIALLGPDRRLQAEYKGDAYDPAAVIDAIATAAGAP